MFSLGRKLLILIATLLVVDPVMACCLPTVDFTKSVSVETQAVPCHGVELAGDALSELTDNNPDCPNCSDCEVMLKAPDVVEPIGVLPQTSGEFEFIEVPRVTGSSELQPIITLLTPPLTPRICHTPISLKQRLLV